MASERLILPALAYLSVITALGPALAELSGVTRVIVASGIIGGMIVDVRDRRIPSWLLTLAAVCGTIFSLSRFSWANPVMSFLNVTAILLAIRLLAEKNRRTYLQLFGLAFVALAATSIIRLDTIYAVAMAILLTSGIVALVILTAQELPSTNYCPPQVINRLIGIGLLLTATAIPLLICFFLILPRTQLPLWNLGAAAATGSGFSEQVQPGKSSSQQLSQRVAFRAEVTRPLAPSQLYWRATVLNHFTGTRWLRTAPPQVFEPLKGGAGDEISQTIYLEPGMGRYLVSLDLPATISGVRFTMASDSVLTSPRAGMNRLRYQVISRPLASKSAPKTIAEDYAVLPEEAPARLVALGKEIGRQQTTSASRLQRIEELFQQQRLHYATTGLATSPNAVDDFFFAVKRGNCEFFASSAAIMLRAAGVPTRLVGGYLGGDFSAVGSFYTISDERAHVWVEALLDEQWQRIDPSRWAVNGANLGQPSLRSLKARLTAITNLLEYFWTRSVISYDFQQQMATADRVVKTMRMLPSPANLKRWGLWGSCGIVTGAVIWALFHWRRPEQEDQILRLLARRLGLAQLPTATCLLKLAQQCPDQRLQRTIRLYAATIYRGQRLSPLRYRRLKRLLSARANRD